MVKIRNACLLAAVLAGTAPNCFAESYVAISGELDTGLQHQKDARGATLTGLQNGGFAASRLIISGAEDLGGGLSAKFKLEMAPNLTTGNVSRFGMFNRNASLSLKSERFGELMAGRFLTPTANLLCEVDLHWCASGFNGTGIMYNGDGFGRWISGSPGRGGNANAGISVFSGGDGTPGSAESNRKNHALEYISPRINGFQFKLMYARGDTGNGANDGEGDHIGGTLTYHNNNLMLGIGHERVESDPLWNAKGNLTSIGGVYKLDQLKIGAIFQYERASGPRAQWTKATSWAITGAYRVQAFEPYVKFGQHRTNGIGAYGIEDGTDSFVANIGTLYFLSKRTKLYADFATDLKGSSGAGQNYRDPQSFKIGINHSF